MRKFIKDIIFLNKQKLAFYAILLLVVSIAGVFLTLSFRGKSQLLDEAPVFLEIDGKIIISRESPLRNQLVIQPALTERVNNRITAPAKVEANPSTRANIFSPVGGRVIRLHVQMGQEVRQGQVLLELHSPLVAEVQAGYIACRSALAHAERELSRKMNLHELGITPARELEEAIVARDIAANEKESALLKLKILGIPPGDIGQTLVVRSPTSGRVIDLSVAEGEYIQESSGPLMIVANLNEVWVTASIQEKDIRFVRPGVEAVARFTAYPGEEYRGKVLLVNDILDEESRSVKVRIGFDNKDWRLKPGMFANVEFTVPMGEWVLLPPTAIKQSKDYGYVYVARDSISFEPRRVQTGDMQGGNVIILDGVEPGELVITRNAILLP